jgi:hypothetical protein
MMSTFGVMISSGLVPSTVTVPVAGMPAPSAFPTMAAGIVGFGFVPLWAIAVGSPATLFTIRAPIAPAAWALRTFVVKSQVPRSMTAILPETAVVIAVQPFAGLVFAYPAVTAGSKLAKSPRAAPNVAPPWTETSIPMKCGLVVAPEVSAPNALPGEPIV